MALPLSVVERIETVALKDVEYAGGKPLLQYRGELLPLLDAGGVLQELEAADGDGFSTVLICGGRAGETGGARRMGMVVRRVVDVASGALLDRDVRVCEERLAMVNDRLTVVHEAFAVDAGWRSVA